MKKIYFYILFACGATIFASCNDFLNEYPKDLGYVLNTSDLDELLIGEGYMPATTGTDLDYWLQIMDDDALFTTTNTQRLPYVDFYWWEPDVNTESAWTVLYKRIGVTNSILGKIDDFSAEGDDYRKVKGEALFLRAAYYYFLTNLYGFPYRTESANTDPGVPIKISEVIEDKRFTRNTVLECYDRIVTDLQTSIACLKGLPVTSPFRGNEWAARHLLSRVYLYLNNWQESVNQCDTIIQSRRFMMLDFTTFGVVGTVNAVYADSPETIFTNGSFTIRGTSWMMLGTPKFTMSAELYSLYDADDLRKTYYFRGMGAAYLEPQKWANVPTSKGSDFFIFRFPEVYLNRAEAMAMLGKDQEARDDIQLLRATRYRSGTLPTLSLSGEELIHFIRDERRRELSFEGQRWFDLRRYAVSPKWPFQKEIRHAYYEYATVSGDMVLKRYDEEPEYYVLPLPESEISLNAGAMRQNPPRAVKEAQ
ncbi:MAG: RagB/SusD family nutrient uptake outer membrane protein [Dysgonamonadaceae bacterium]|jgi:hypothetical protein|nr:RagB/SusD family nutrient uptake outer membrane protein [Dysgonamonadaceae bacterium]